MRHTDNKRIKWRVLVYCVLGTLALYAVLIPLKLRGQFRPEMAWADLLVLCAIAPLPFAAMFFWDDWRGG